MWGVRCRIFAVKAQEAAMEILVGTTKGLFVLEGGRVEGPFCEGWPINHAIGRGGEIVAAGGGKWEGAGVWRRCSSMF